MVSRASAALLVGLLLVFATAAHAGGYGNDGGGGYGGGGGSSRASASASASASSESFGGGGGGGYNKGYYRRPYYGGGGGYDQGRGNCYWGGCNQWGGKKLLSLPSMHDFMSALGFADAAGTKDVAMTQSTMFGAHPDKIVEMSDHFEVLVLIPGFTSKDEVAAEIQHGILMVNGQKAKLADNDQQGSSSSSSSGSSFAHSLAVPHNINARLMTAHVSDAGVLMVKLPKQ